MKSGKNNEVRLSKQNKLLINILIISIAVVFCLLAVLVYINYYTRVRLVLTTVSRYQSGDIKNVTEYEVIDVKKGRNISNLPHPDMEGYVFGGWYKDINYTQPFDYNEQLMRHMQVYGKFTLIEYNIELVLDGETKVTLNQSKDIDYTRKYTIEDLIYFPKVNDILTLDDGTETSIADYKNSNKYGYTFEGWGLSATASTTYPDEYLMRAQNMTFYAVWRPIQVELRYKSQNLDFTGSKITGIRDRIDNITGGLTYQGEFTNYEKIVTQFNSKVEAIIAPVDRFENFEFAGWYLDPEFLFPLNVTQLYVKSGYFTMTQTRDVNILYDDLYYRSASINPNAVSIEHRQTISSYSSTVERDCYITLFAKWKLKEYKINFNLNIPYVSNELRNYIVTDRMREVVVSSTPNIINVDKGEYVKPTFVSQGWKLYSDYGISPVVYSKNFFKDAVYREGDQTGLPLYTLLSWNTKRDGSGFSIDYTNQIYFDKSDFVDSLNVVENEITLYAQWQSYYRVNYYYKGISSSQKSVLLSTVNVDKNTIELPNFYNIVSSVNEKGLITFTQKQIDINNISSNYVTPLNYSFAGWRAVEDTYDRFTKLYLPNFSYDIGTQTVDAEGIRLNNAQKNLYTTWISNNNYYTYDLGSTGEFSFQSEAIKDAILNEDGNVVYNTTYTSQVLKTISGETYQVTKVDNGVNWVLSGWKLKDGTLISGTDGGYIRFNSENAHFVYNSVTYKREVNNVRTNVYLPGNVSIDNENYFTQYSELEDKSYIYLKFYSKILTFEADWNENVVLKFYVRGNDIIWENQDYKPTPESDGTYRDDVDYCIEKMTTLGAGTLYMTMHNLPKTIAKRPYYEFAGWSTINREAEGISYSDFISRYSNKLYLPNQKYSAFQFSKDTKLYAIWKPVVFSVELNQLSQSSSVNYSAGTVYLAREKFTDGSKRVTDRLLLTGNLATYNLEDGSTQNLLLSTSTVVGKGFAGWLNSSGNELVKSEKGYELALVNSEANKFNINLFKQFPSSSSDYFIKLYPKFDDLKFGVTFKLSGTGIEGNSADCVLKDVKYGTSIRTLLSQVSVPGYQRGYEHAGWLVSGDKDNDGTLKADYLIDLHTANLGVKSDLVLTLVAKKQAFSVRFIYNNPSTGITEEIQDFTLDYYSTIEEIYPQVEEKLNGKAYTGYNFKYWQVAGGGSSTAYSNIKPITIVSPLNIYPIFVPAEVKVVYNYYSEDSTNSDKMETVEFVSMIGDTHIIDSSGFAVQPKKDNGILAGWTFNNVLKLENGDSLVLDFAQLGSNLQEYTVEEDNDRHYKVVLNVVWSEAVKLTIDLTDVTLNGVTIPSEMVVAKDTKLYFKDISVLSTLNKGQLYKNEYTMFTGKWVDENGNIYDAYLNTSFINMTENKTIKPVFESVVFTIEYWYRYSDNYYKLDGVKQSYELNYTEIPKLCDLDELANYIMADYRIADYTCIALYLGVVAFENGDTAYKFQTSDEFDFANYQPYMDRSENYVFKFYMDLKKLTSITYYMDRTETAPSVNVKIAEGSYYVVGTSKLGLTTPDIIPAKTGYVFKGWSKSIASTVVSYSNGNIVEYSTALFGKLYPVWETAKIFVRYFEEDGTLNDVEPHDCYSTITLRGDVVVEGTKIKGWQINKEGTLYMPNSSFVLADKDVDFYAVREKYYTIYYYNGVSDTGVTLNERIISNEKFTPKSFETTGLTAKLGANFEGWSISKDRKALVADFVINSRNGNILILDNGNIILESDDDYIIKLYASWEDKKFHARFSSFDESGNESYSYGKTTSPTTLVETLETHNYDETMYNFVFPTTASEYTLSGETYRFTGIWQDETGKTYTSSSVDINFVKTYEFTPVYKKVIALKFVVGDKTLYSQDVVGGMTFSLNNSNLLEQINNYNNTLVNTAIIGWELNGVFYSHLTSTDNGYNYRDWNKSLLVNASAELTAVVVNLFDIKIYTNIIYDSKTNSCLFDESSSEILNGYIEGDTVNLNGYSLSGKYITAGWVVNNDSAYKYNKNASYIENSFTITSMLVSANTIYAYPMIKIEINYAVDSKDNVKKTAFVFMGDASPKIEDIFVGDNYYLGDWQLENGDAYNYTPLFAPTTLIAQAMPYYTIQMADAENRIDNSLVFTKLTPDTEITLPVDDDKVIYDKVANGGGLKLLGWYIKDIVSNQFVMNGSTRKEFALGEKVTIRSFEEAGITSEERTYGLVPKFEYTLQKITLAHMYSAIKYSITYSSNDGNTYANLDSNNNYEFYVLKNSTVVVENARIIFVAYLVKNGSTVIENYDAVKNTVYVSAGINPGYSFSITDGWFECSYDETNKKYIKGQALQPTLNVSKNMMVTANEPTAETISVSFGLANEYYNKLGDISRAYFVSGETKVYGISKTVKSGTLITQTLYLVNGYELQLNANGDVVVLNAEMSDITGNLDILFSIKNNVVTITYTANNSGSINLVVKPCSEVDLKLTLDSSGVSGYTADNILAGSTVDVYCNQDMSWKLVETVSFENLIAGSYTLSTKISANTKIKVQVNLKSYHYYVNHMILSGVGGLDKTINSYLLEDYEVALAPEIRIVLDNRTYSIDVYFNNEFKESTTPAIVENTNNINLNTYPLANTMLFGGYKFSAVNDGGTTSLCKFVNGVTANISASELIKKLEHVTSKNEVIKAEGICYAKSITVTIKGENLKSLVNGELQKSFAVPIGGKIVVSDNKITMPVGSYSVNSNGELVGVTVTTISLAMLGSYQFEKWTVSGKDFLGTTATTDLEITGLSKAGMNKVTASVVDLSDASNCNLVGLSVADLKVTGLQTAQTTAYYDDSLKQNGLVGDFTTATAVKIEYKLYSGFVFDGYEIYYNSISSKNYSSLSEFASACGITISLGDKYLLVENAIYDIQVVVNLKRVEYSTNILLVETTQSTDSLTTLYQTLKSNGTVFAKYNDTNNITFVSQKFTDSLFRKTLNIKIAVNNDYFVLDKIYLNSEANTVYPSEKVDFASFNAQNNILSLYSGGSGENITIYVTVKFKEFRAVFHKPDNSEFGLSELVGGVVTQNTTFAFDTVQSFDTSSFAVVKNGVVSLNRNYSFVGWKYYNGNYEEDVKNGTVDFSKLSNINSFEYDFKTNNNLHLFGEWDDLYSVSFNANGGDVEGIPSTITNAKLEDNVALNRIPTREGFDFVGWYYVYGGAKYYLNYNGLGFNKLVNEFGDPVGSDLSEISGTDVLLKQLLTASQIADNSASSYEIILQANWNPYGINITLNYDSTMCEIEQQVYNGKTYVNGTISFTYQDKLQHTVVTLDKDYHALVVLNYLNEIKGRIICKPNESYEFKEIILNEIVLNQNNSSTLNGDTRIDVVCWGEFTTHNISLNWDKLFSDVVGGTHYGSLGGHGSVSATKSTTAKYNFLLNISLVDSLTNVSTSGVGKIKLINSSEIEVLNTVSAGSYYINDNFDINKILVEVRKGYEVKIVLNMAETPYIIDTTKNTFVSLDGTNYVFVITSDDTLEHVIDFTLNTKNVNLSSDFVDSSITSFGKYELMYYVPNKNENGLITGYTLKNENVNANKSDKFTLSVVSDSVITINYNSNDFVLNKISGLGNSSLNNGSWKISVKFDDTTENYILEFDYNYIKYNFNINGNVYASAYFKTQNVDNSANQKLQAFYKLITYGVLDISSSIRNIISSTSEGGEYTNIVKSISPITYYTNNELFGTGGYEYSVNENLVKNRSAQIYSAIWFEEWLIKVTFGEEVNEDTISVVGGNQIVNINAGTFDAIMFTLNTNLENGASGGVKYVTVAGVKYAFVVVKAVEAYRNDSNKYYGELTLKVKNGTNLPQFSLAYDDNTYLFGTNYALSCNGKTIGNTEKSDIVVDSNEYIATISLKVKKLTLKVSTNMDSFNGTMTITHSTTFENVLKEMGLKYNYYLEDVYKSTYYSIIGLFVDDEQIDQTYIDFDYYLNNIIGFSYEDDGVINLVVRYQELSKAQLSISAMTSRNGVDSGEMIYSVQLYYVAGTEIAGQYNNGFDEYIPNSYKNRTMITSNNVCFENIQNGVLLNGNVLTTNTTWYYENFVNISGSVYQEKFSGWHFAYLTSKSSSVGTILTDSDTQILANDCYLVLLKNSIALQKPVNGEDGQIVREKYTTPKNVTYSLSGDSTLYAVFVPTTRVVLKSQNYTDVVTSEYVFENQVEFGISNLSNLIVAYRNKLISSNIDVSNLEADYVMIDGVRYDIKDGGNYNQIVFNSSSNIIEIYVVWKESE